MQRAYNWYVGGLQKNQAIAVVQKRREDVFPCMFYCCQLAAALAAAGATGLAAAVAGHDAETGAVAEEREAIGKRTVEEVRTEAGPPAAAPAEVPAPKEAEGAEIPEAGPGAAEPAAPVARKQAAQPSTTRPPPTPTPSTLPRPAWFSTRAWGAGPRPATTGWRQSLCLGGE